MFCKQCGNSIENSKAIICVKCGTSKGKGESFCQECGTQIQNPNATACLTCGVGLKSSLNLSAMNGLKDSTGSNNKVIAALLAFFLSPFGAHRFYLGYNKLGIIMLAATILLSFTVIVPLAIYVWGIVDFVLILTGNLRTASGQDLA